MTEAQIEKVHQALEAAKRRGDDVTVAACRRRLARG